MKQWGQLKGENSWTMFKVISEFVDGFETLNRLGPCVSIFGSARVKPDHPHYQLAENTSTNACQLYQVEQGKKLAQCYRFYLIRTC